MNFTQRNGLNLHNAPGECLIAAHQGQKHGQRQQIPNQVQRNNAERVRRRLPWFACAVEQNLSLHIGGYNRYCMVSTVFNTRCIKPQSIIAEKTRGRPGKLKRRAFSIRKINWSFPVIRTADLETLDCVRKRHRCIYGIAGVQQLLK
jgi:hypothetical protein